MFYSFYIFQVRKTFSSIQGCLPGLTWGKNEHCQPLVALRPLDADKPFIFPPREARKTTLNTGKRFPHLENVKRIEHITFSDFAAFTTKVRTALAEKTH